jgi:tubulin polyglutamylase TTLL4
MNPHLINGLKYDLRVYVLVTSYCPLKVYLYNDGLVRFATEPYSNDPRSVNQKFMHLTNFSINKKNTAKFVKNNDHTDSSDAEAHGPDASKWDFKQLESAFAKQGASFGAIKQEIKSICLKTLISVETQINLLVQKNPTTRNNCFELYGFDVMIDSNLKPWVLEVNVLPSLSSSSVFDKRIKTMLVCDALTIVGIRGYDKLEFKDL